ncbi:unnamed protein product (macronuclear) [Paramecium tetraurelia]|uniref:PAS domain-containing protein n=1 Tax=Paramecium tetraurelia TaxID=5888 RepID=A0C5S1_PARTE|nr:uncharacterized protein GSPATT00035267001 [Paramecium tetraurelia]CAK66138.1 unnamed protein product [Paramecium tetraurelia]|eukprot:XP_001433535.1 hypothetical protein (macronuclear) [Paramecium tetraurelia strain d4-2]
MELKSNFGGKSSLDQDKSAIDKIQNEVKLIYFKVTQSLLKEEEQSIVLNLLAIIIQFFQATYIIFNRQTWKIWQTFEVTEWLNKIFGYSMLVPYFKMLSFPALVAMMYVCLGLVVFAFMLIFFLSYRLKSAFTWPIYILRILIQMFLSILYMPIMDLFFSLIACTTDENGDNVNQIFNDVTCWQGVHIVHGIVSILGIVIFYLFCITFAMIYYEPRYLPKEPHSKKSGRNLTIFLTYELVMIICYTFMVGRSYDYLFILIMLVGSFIVFWKMHIENPHNNVYIAKMWSMLVSVNMWSVILLCFAKFLEGQLFFGTIYAWLSGLPLMIIAVLKTEKLNYDLLLTNLNKVTDPQDVLNLTDHLIKLYNIQDADSQLMIDGFLEIHRATCAREDCYLKQKKLPNQRLAKPFFKDQNLQERDVDLLMVLGQIYFNQIKRFPNEISLRLRYSLFLLDLMKQRQQALNELIQTEQLCPSFDNEFIIFRYKQIVEYEMNAAQNENMGNLDVATELAFQNHMRSFQNKIERATLMHMDFWSQLQEDSPDLGKMNNIGAKINLAITQVEELWNKMQMMTQNLPKAMRLYGKFIIEVLQDKDYGEELLEKARRLQQQNSKNKNKQMISILSGEDLSQEPNPTTLVSTAAEKFAQIINLNLSCCNLFGYSKSEMINRKINIFMPNLYAKFHDSYVEHFLQTNDNKNINKERLIYIKLKSNYIAPCFLMLKIIQSLDDNLQLAAQFRLPKIFRPTCYIITDSEEVIDSISASCIPLLSIDQKVISHKKVSLLDIFPKFAENKSQYLTKLGGLLQFSAQQSQFSNSNITEEKEQDQITFMCYMSEVMNDTIDSLAGYVVRLEQQGQDQSVNQELLANNNALKSGSSLQFKFNPQRAMFSGEFVADTNSQRVDQTILWDQNDQSSMISSNQVDVLNTGNIRSQMKTDKSEEQNLNNKINYGEGIKILRLFENRIQDIDDKDEIMSDDEEIGKNSVFQNNQEQAIENDQQRNEQNNIFRSRKNLYQIINSNQTPKVITKLGWTANILALILVVLSFVDFFIIYAQYEDIYNTILLVRSQNQRNAELQTITTSVQNLLMLNLDVWQLKTDADKKAYETTWKTKLNNSITNVDNLNKELMLSNVGLSDSIVKQLSTDIVTMRSSDGNEQLYDLSEAIQQIISKSLIIREKNIANISMKDIDVKFVLYNSLNSLIYQLRLFSTMYANELRIKTQNNGETFLLILGVSAAAIGLGLIIMIIAMISVSKNQEEVLAMFLDLPDKTVKYLYNKSENFISNLQMGEDDEMMSEIDDGEKEEQEELNKTLKTKRKKKKFKNTNKDQRNFIFGIFFVLSVTQGYFVLNYILSNTFLTNLDQMIPEINATARAESFYRFVDIGERALFLDRNQTILNEDAYTIVKNNLNSLYTLDSSMHQEHSLNVEITNQIYLDAFKEMFMSQPCTIMATVMNEVIEQDCQTFADGAIFQGMAVGVARYFENLRYIMTIYDQFWNNSKANFTQLARGFATFKNITKNQDNTTNLVLNLNNFNHTKEARQMQDNYHRGTFRYLIKKMIEGIYQDMESSRTQLLAFFIVFEVLLFVIYFILWLPLVVKMTKDIWRTRAMIMMIPLRVIQNIRSIKAYIKDNIQINDIDV